MQLPPGTTQALTGSPLLSSVDIPATPSLSKAPMTSPASRVHMRPVAGDSSPSHVAATSPPSMGDSLASPPSTERLAAYDSSPSARAIRNRVSLKRCYLVALPSDEDEAKASPRKKPKSLLTSASVKRNSELEDLHAMRLLELVRASRATFTAHAKYQRLRLKELDIVRSMAIDECEEAESLLKEVEWQAGEVKNAVDQDGPGLLNRASGLFLREDDGNLDSESEDNLSDCKGSGPSNHNLASPTPSVDSSSDVS